MRVALVALLAATLQPLSHPVAAQGAAPATCTRTTGLELPPGFCAIVVATGVAHVRHITVLSNGDVFAASGNGVVALRDTNGDGVADQREQFGAGPATGIVWHNGALWLGENTRVVRWDLPLGRLKPAGDGTVIVQDLPVGGHATKPLVHLGGDSLIVGIGSLTNSCQVADRSARSPGRDPCTELETRAGLWLFHDSRPGQRQRDGARFATGLRDAIAIGRSPEGKVLALPHGRDQLSANWGFSDSANAELPAEELVQVGPGEDAGWPYCYFDPLQGKKVLAPEYGGDGRETGRCAQAKAPILAFPGHWAPMAFAFAQGSQYPAKYRGGLFVAFHGSWNRAPLPQAGYRIEFAPYANGRPTGAHEVFATSSEGPTTLRASGVAVGPDGSVYIAGENSGTVWRVMAQQGGQ
jgi:glucose/arabinose dehydrogenase